MTTLKTLSDLHSSMCHYQLEADTHVYFDILYSKVLYEKFEELEQRFYSLSLKSFHYSAAQRDHEIQIFY